MLTYVVTEAPSRPPETVVGSGAMTTGVLPAPRELGRVLARTADEARKLAADCWPGRRSVVEELKGAS